MGRSKKKDPLKIYDMYEIVENEDRKSDSSPVVFFITHLFQCSCNSAKSHWESALKGGKMGEECNSCCAIVMPYQQLIGPTPYKGEKRVYGSFRCHKCSRTWESANSWAATSQKCEPCQIQIFPFDQDNLKFKGIRNREKGHQIAFCEMCVKINDDCSKIDTNPYADPSRGPRPRNNRSRRTRTSKQKVVSKIEASGNVISAVKETSNLPTTDLKDTNGTTSKTTKRKRRNRKRVKQRNGNGGETLPKNHEEISHDNNALINAVKNLQIS